MKISTLLLVLIFAITSNCTFADESDPLVKTNKGTVQGTVNGDVRVFRGIPYAEPPVDELRWRAPKPKEKWDGVLDATDYGPNCPQPRRGRTPEDEDCLTLNVWAPKETPESLPVMFWIHGGAHTLGSGRIDGSAFPRSGIVLVSINYRLGRLGVFAHPDLTESLEENEPTGNFHLLDQIAALRWVQEEIEHFGGDPNKVTIFGVSAGGSNVNLLMASPLSQGLFHGAISQSGANGLSQLRNLGIQEGFGVSLAVSKDVESFDELRSLPWESIATSDATYQRDSGPIVDGMAVVESVPDSFRGGRQHAVPYIGGANSFEGSLRRAIPIPAFDAALAADRENIAATYQLKPDDPALALDFYGDMLFVAPTRFLVKGMKSVNAPSWQYHFDYVFDALVEHVPGASHGSEVQYVFDILSTINLPPAFAERLGLPAGRYEPSESDLNAAATVHGYWVQFAKTGNPNGEGMPAWTEYTLERPATMVISNDGIQTRTAVRKTQLDLVESLYARQSEGM